MENIQEFQLDDKFEEELMSTEKEKKKLARGRGKETLFRVSARNQIELIAIADNKANMITGISVLLISVIIALLSSGAVIGGTPVIQNFNLVVPVIFLMVVCLCSAILGILSAKPMIIDDTNETHHSLLFFQNFYNKPVGQYLTEMKELLNTREGVYEQLIIDMYHNGLVLRRKYQLLKWSYSVFMIGLILTVLVFVGVNFF